MTIPKDPSVHVQARMSYLVIQYSVIKCFITQYMVYK